MIDQARDLLRSPKMRGAVQICIIVALIVVGWSVRGLSNEAEKSGQETTSVTAILARSCGAASFEELRRQGLVEECRLAQGGDLPDAIPDDDLPDADADVDDVTTDVVEDDDSATPADLQPSVSDDRIRVAVDDYFEANPLPTQDGYERAIKRTVAAYLVANPPAPGKTPTQAEVREVVRTALLANPPADGADGRGVAAAASDGCDVVFTYSDGDTSRVGPLCGADGKPGPTPSDAQIATAVAAYCNANGECRGPQGPIGPEGPRGETGKTGIVQVSDECNPPPGNVVTDADPIYDVETQTFTLRCTYATVLEATAGGGG